MIEKKRKLRFPLILVLLVMVYASGLMSGLALQWQKMTSMKAAYSKAQLMAADFTIKRQDYEDAIVRLKGEVFQLKNPNEKLPPHLQVRTQRFMPPLTDEELLNWPKQ